MTRAIEDARVRFGLGRRAPALSLAGPAARGPWEAWTLLSAIAASTTRIELGPLVACTNFHNPALLAKQAATIDEISGGRFVLGLGRRLERDRVPRLRLPVRPPDRPLRGGVHDHPDAAPRRRDRLRRALVPGARLRAAAARAATGRAAADDRLDRAADAARHHGPRRRLELLVQRHGQPPAGVPRVRAIVDEACRDVGRDPADDRTVGGGPRPPAGRQRPDPGQHPAASSSRSAATPRRSPTSSARTPAKASPRSSSCSIRSPAARSRRSHPMLADLDRG